MINNNNMQYLVEDFMHNMFDKIYDGGKRLLKNGIRSGKRLITNFFSNTSQINEEQYEYLRNDAQQKVQQNIKAYNKLKKIILDPSYQVISPRHVGFEELRDISIHRFFYLHKDYDNIILKTSKSFNEVFYEKKKYNSS